MPTIDKEFQSLIPPPSDDEYKQLEVNILTDGCRDPISLWGDIILDGHNRFKICQEHDIPFNTVQIEVADRDDAMLWIVQNQLGRRNLTPSQMKYFRGEWYKQDKQQGQRADLTCGQNVHMLEDDGSTSGQSDHMLKDVDQTCGQNDQRLATTSEKIARQTGVSEKTVRRDAQFASAVDKIASVAGPEARTSILTANTIKTQRDVLAIADMADDAPDLVTDVVQGEKTVEQARQELRARSNPTPVDRFKVLYADPDWSKDLRAMGLDIQEQSEDDSVLFLWVPSSLLEKSFDVVKSWNFKYQASFVRDLGAGDSEGQYNQANHEFLLLCVRGKCEPMVRIASVVEVESRAQVKELIDLMYPDGRRFDLFDRDGEWFVEEDQEEESSGEGF